MKRKLARAKNDRARDVGYCLIGGVEVNRRNSQRNIRAPKVQPGPIAALGVQRHRTAQRRAVTVTPDAIRILVGGEISRDIEWSGRWRRRRDFLDDRRVGYIAGNVAPSARRRKGRPPHHHVIFIASGAAVVRFAGRPIPVDGWIAAVPDPSAFLGGVPKPEPEVSRYATISSTATKS